MRNKARFSRPFEYMFRDMNKVDRYLAAVDRASRLFEKDGYLRVAGPGLDRLACPFGRLEVLAWNKYMA
jgi:hypothetical protein